MLGHKGCGHWGKGKGDMSEWKENYEKMDSKEKKEMLEKMAWVEEELKKLG